MVRACGVLLLGCLSLTSLQLSAGDQAKDLEALQREIEALNRELDAPPAGVRSSVDQAMDSKFGPNAATTTRSGKLVVSGLISIWYYSIQNDSRGLFNNPDEVLDSNQASDNDGFRVRRTELKFTAEINENITGVLMIDPARENGSVPLVSSNQGAYKRRNNVAPEISDDDASGSRTAIRNVQTGAGNVPNILQDAYINWHGVLPHHDSTIGQFKPPFGEEGIRSSANLDFIERSLIGLGGDARDIGGMIHGTWWNDRFQYWGGGFNGAGNYWASAGQFQNRSDDNDEKDYYIRALIRPVWDDCWGKLELGGSLAFGTHGESANADPGADPVRGLNRNKQHAQRGAAWISYFAPGKLKGLWVRGEYLHIRDRNAPGQVIDTEDGGTQTAGKGFAGDGFYASMGYRFGEQFCMPEWAKKFEIAFRVEQFYNVQVQDLTDPSHTDNYKTRIATAGLNYYLKGSGTKLQLNYSIVDEPESDTPNFHEVKNNSLVVNFQVAF